MSANRPIGCVTGSLGQLQLTREGTATWLDEPFVTGLSQAVRSLTHDPRVERLLIHGSPGQFVHGVDVGFFLECLEAGDVDRLLSFVRLCRDLLATIAGSAKPIVAWVDGPALGGGLELALACHRIVAGPKAKFCLPETGLGIYPGMGGTQRLPRRIGVGLAKWMIYTGSIVPVEHAARIGLVDVLAPSPLSAEQAWAALSQPVQPAPLEARYRDLAEHFAQNSVDRLLNPALPMPSEAQIIRALVQMRAAAPRALRLAEAAIDHGMALPLEAGLDEEYAHLAEVFSTADALAGLKALGKSKPKFTGG